MKCNKTGCENDAKYQIGFRAWAQGHPKTTIPIDSFVSLAVCEDHKVGVEMKDITSSPSNIAINNQLIAIGKCPIDFESAEVIFHDLIDDKLYMPGE